MATGSLQNIIAANPNTPTGGIMKGDLDSPLPTDATTALDASFGPLGYVVDEGPTISPTVETSTERAWGGQVVKVLTTAASVDVTIPLYEMLSVDVLKAAYGDEAVTVTAATATTGTRMAIAFKGELPDAVPYVFDAKDKKVRVRVVFPLLQVTEQGELNFNSSETTKPTLTAVAQPDADGVLMYIYTDDGVFAA